MLRGVLVFFARIPRPAGDSRDSLALQHCVGWT